MPSLTISPEGPCAPCSDTNSPDKLTDGCGDRGDTRPAAPREGRVVSKDSGGLFPPNKLYFGDNLEWLSKMDANSVDLIYLDPPFNSKAAYNILYKSPDGEASQAQYQTFVNSWQWGPSTDAAMAAVLASGSPSPPY